MLNLGEDPSDALPTELDPLRKLPGLLHSVDVLDCERYKAQKLLATDHTQSAQRIFARHDIFRLHGNTIPIDTYRLHLVWPLEIVDVHQNETHRLSIDRLHDCLLGGWMLDGDLVQI